MSKSRPAVPSREALHDYREAWNESPFIALLGAKLAHHEHGRARLELIADRKHTNMQGGVHGGVLSTLIDSAMSSAVRSYIGPETVLLTVEMKVNFLGTCHQGDHLVAEGEVLRLGRQILVTRATVSNGEGKMLMAGQGTFMALSSDTE